MIDKYFDFRLVLCQKGNAQVKGIVKTFKPFMWNNLFIVSWELLSLLTINLCWWKKKINHVNISAQRVHFAVLYNISSKPFTFSKSKVLAIFVIQVYCKMKVTRPNPLLYIYCKLSKTIAITKNNKDCCWYIYNIH